MTFLQKKSEFASKIEVKKPNSMELFKAENIRLDVNEMQKVEGGRSFQLQIQDFSWSSFCGNIAPQ